MKNSIKILYGAFLLELCLLFIFRNEAGFFLSPLFMTLSGLLLAIYPIFLFRKGFKTDGESKQKSTQASLLSSSQVWIIQGILNLIFVFSAYFLFQKYPIDINHSDIIPFIRDILVKRFLDGENVYAIVSGFNHYPNAFIPNYFPFHWFPFILPGIFHFDPRWMTVFIFSLSAFLHTRLNLNPGKTHWVKLILLQLPLLIGLIIHWKQGSDFASNIEMLVMAYYLFLANSLFFVSSVFRSVGLIFPLLSRYSYLFWLPVYFYGLMRKNLRIFFVTGIGFALLILGIFVIPFVIPNPEIMKQSSDIYLDGAVREWSGQSWQAAGDKPFQLFQGMGFASWFYYWAEGELKAKVVLLKSVLLGICLLSTLLPILFHRKIRKYISADWFSLLALKFCLTLFYAFILVPYVYLFWVGMMVSAAILIKAYKAAEIEENSIALPL